MTVTVEQLRELSNDVFALEERAARLQLLSLAGRLASIRRELDRSVGAELRRQWAGRFGGRRP